LSGNELSNAHADVPNIIGAVKAIPIRLIIFAGNICRLKKPFFTACAFRKIDLKISMNLLARVFKYLS
jgi:hypothetical protein